HSGPADVYILQTGPAGGSRPDRPRAAPRRGRPSPPGTRTFLHHPQRARIMLPSSLRRLLPRHLRPARRGRLPARRPAAAGRRPRLETLEDRTSPAVVRWVAGSGNWATPANWRTGRVPGPTDEVVINVSGTITVTHSQANDSIHSLISENDLAFTGGSLTVSGDSTLDSTFTLSGGTLTSRGSLTLNDVFTWTGGTLAGRGHTEVNAGMVVSGPGGKSLNNQTLDDAA